MAITQQQQTAHYLVAQCVLAGTIDPDVLQLAQLEQFRYLHQVLAAAVEHPATAEIGRLLHAEAAVESLLLAPMRAAVVVLGLAIAEIEGA